MRAGSRIDRLKHAWASRGQAAKDGLIAGSLTLAVVTRRELLSEPR